MTERTTVARSGYNISALETGQGAGAPVVLFSNSLGTGLGMWDHQRELLGKTHRVIGFDTRGHGQSDAPEGDYTMAELVDDALAVLDHFDVDQAYVVGLSLGGMTAMGIGLKAPDRVSSIVVAAARADAPPPFVQSWDDRIDAIAKGGMAAIWPGTLERWLTPDFRDAHPETVAALESDFLATSTVGYAGCAAALKGLDYLKDLGAMKRPAVYVAGAEDMAAPAAAMQAMADATPGATFVSIPGAAHIANINAPSEFDAVMRDALKA